MVYVPAGEFMMGCNSKVDDACDDDEKPYHEVYLDAYYIDKYEVTQGEYDKCVQAGECDENEKYDGFTGSKQPVVGVDWKDAKTYCEWAGKRLPTEAEWEKAARGTDGRIYPWGNEEPTCEYAVFDPPGGENGCGRDKTWDVGSKPKGASPYGALDMAGNVWEWVADWYDGDYYGRSGNRNPEGPNNGKSRVVRGGGWYYFANNMRASTRLWFDPEDRSYGGGFRCSRD